MQDASRTATPPCDVELSDTVENPQVRRWRMCTIAAKNYLPSVQLLVESFRRHHPDIPVSVLVVDAQPGDVIDHLGFDAHRLGDLPIGDLATAQMATYYDVTELSTALKPYLLQRLLDHGETAVMYLDPDIEVFAPLQDLFELAERHQIVLTPHMTEPTHRGDAYLPEELTSRAGQFNLGFIAVDKGAATVPRVLEGADADVGGRTTSARGYFTDQRWVDAVPTMFTAHRGPRSRVQRRLLEPPPADPRARPGRRLHDRRQAIAVLPLQRARPRRSRSVCRRHLGDPAGSGSTAKRAAAPAAPGASRADGRPRRLEGARRPYGSARTAEGTAARSMDRGGPTGTRCRAAADRGPLRRRPRLRPRARAAVARVAARGLRPTQAAPSPATSPACGRARPDLQAAYPGAGGEGRGLGSSNGPSASAGPSTETPAAASRPAGPRLNLPGVNLVGYMAGRVRPGSGVADWWPGWCGRPACRCRRPRSTHSSTQRAPRAPDR